MERVCEVCDAKAPHRCSSCLTVWYCSGEHQKEHWKIHRKNCKFFKIVEGPKLGKGFVATRDIKSGTIILEEAPVGFAGTELACLSCGVVADKLKDLKAVRKCSQCKWPVCSLECEKFPWHSENECLIFASQNFPYQNVQSQVDLVMGIRVCLLKRRSPAMYEQVLQLCSEYLFPDIGHEHRLLGLEYNLKMLLAGRVEMVSEEIQKLLRIFHINCFESAIEEKKTKFDPSIQVRTVVGLYLESSRMNHSCIPNCHWELHSKPEFKIRVRTTSAVKKGEALTVSYYCDCVDKSTERRQETIRNKGSFLCECKRCKDPTELGTYMSGIVCKSCRGNKKLGYLLAEDPLNLSADAKWKCNYCGDIQLARNVLLLVEKCAQKISNLEIQFRNTPNDTRLIELCKRFLNETSGIALHHNHWVIQKAIVAMGRYVISWRKETITLSLSDYLIKCLRHLLSVHDLLNLGLTRNRAFLHEQLGALLYLQCDALLSERMYKQVQTNSEESLVHCNEALKFFEKEVPANIGELAAATIKKKLSGFRRSF